MDCSNSHQQPSAKPWELEQLTRNMLESGHGDVTIIAKDGLLPCHEGLLKANPVLRAKLELESPSRNDKKMLLMEGWRKEEVTEFLFYINAGPHPNHFDSGGMTIALYDMGKKFEVPGLWNLMLGTLLDMPVDRFRRMDAQRLFKIAHSIGSKELETKGLKVFQLPAGEDEEDSVHGTFSWFEYNQFVGYFGSSTKTVIGFEKKEEKVKVDYSSHGHSSIVDHVKDVTDGFGSLGL